MSGTGLRSSRQGLAALRHDSADTADAEGIRLLKRAEALARPLADLTRAPAGSAPVICPVFEFDRQIVRTISAVMRFATAVEITTSELRVELIFPADDDAAAYF